jgi:hypothetical protein
VGFRDREGWRRSFTAVKLLWFWMPPEAWEKVGDSEAPSYVSHLGGTGELMMAVAPVGSREAAPTFVKLSTPFHKSEGAALPPLLCRSAEGS